MKVVAVEAMDVAVEAVIRLKMLLRVVIIKKPYSHMWVRFFVLNAPLNTRDL